MWPLGVEDGHTVRWEAEVRGGLSEEGLEDSPGKALPDLAILWLVLKLVLSCYVPILILGVKTRTYRLRRV